MKNLKTLEQYNDIFTRVARIVNEIDPCFYLGPSDEYDSNVNYLLRLIRDHKINTGNFDDGIKKIFFGQNPLEKAESERLSKLNILLRQELKDWLH